MCGSNEQKLMLLNLISIELRIDIDYQKTIGANKFLCESIILLHVIESNK